MMLGRGKQTTAPRGKKGTLKKVAKKKKDHNSDQGIFQR